MVNLMVEEITILFYMQATHADEIKYLGHPRYEVMKPCSLNSKFTKHFF